MSPLSAHEAGLVCLQVLESGGSVSSSVLFEYRARNASSLPSSQLDWLSLDGQCQCSNTTDDERPGLFCPDLCWLPNIRQDGNLLSVGVLYQDTFEAFRSVLAG